MSTPRTRVTCTFTFEAAHRLAWHPGKCRNLHGHSYRLDVSVEGPLDANGVVLDFDTLQDVVRTEVIDVWDHRDLNEVLENPTAENIAVWIFVRVKKTLPQLFGVVVYETKDCYAEYYGE